ncbi:MAG: transporter substrate-binding domain-containing protein [Anaerolineaceae bacterium]|nr:transporter substrate-binding domain-containing protein [Anaerolineaceae bacterium]
MKKLVCTCGHEKKVRYVQRACWIMLSLFVGMLVAGWGNTSEPQVIRVGVYENAPKIYTDANGKVTGFWPALIQAIADDENWEIVWVHGSWDECMDRLMTGQIDLLPDVGWTEERSNRYTFSEEIVLTSWARVYVSKDSTIENILDLEGLTIAGLNGSLNFDGPDGIKRLTDTFGVQSSFIGLDSYSEVFAAVQSGAVNAGVTNKDFGNLNEQRYEIQRTAIIFQPTQIKFAFPKNAPMTMDLKERIDNHLRAYKDQADSIYYLFQEQYLGDSQYRNIIEVTPDWVHNLLLAAGLIIFFLVAVYVLAKLQVRRQTADLEASEKRYQMLANVSPVGIFRTDKFGATTYVNPTWSQISGVSAKNAMGDAWLSVVHPEDRDQLSKGWQKSAELQKKSNADYRFVHQDGSLTWVIGQAVPELDDNDQIVGYVGTITDITERKENEVALQRAMSAERKALDVARTIQEANLALSRYLEIDEVLGVLLDYLNQLVPYDRSAVMLIEEDEKLVALMIRDASGNAILKENCPDLFDLQSNPTMVSMIHNQKSVLVRNTKEMGDWFCPISDEDGGSWIGIPLIAIGQVIGIFALFRNGHNIFSDDDLMLADALAAQAAIAIQNGQLHDELQERAAELEDHVQERTTELEKRVIEVENLNAVMSELMENLSAAVQKAESADRLKSAFLATMSHELRTPLNSIIGFTGILLQKLVGELNTEQEKQLKMVQGSAYHLLNLINDVLDISKIEAGQIQIHYDDFDMNTAVQNSLEKITPMSNQKSLQIDVILPEEKLRIHSDQRRVEQVLINLLNNAVKFTEQGIITLQCEINGNWLITKIMDTGIGISEDAISTLFMPFRQVDSGITRQYEGTGLGLSICKRLVDLMGGEIWVVSVPGEGSTFSFTLPYPRKE